MKKIFSFIFAIFLILPCMFMLTACGKDKQKVEFRVSENYIQWTNDGINWENIISVNDLKGQQGIQGIPGKQVEFQATETHIQWKYVGETTWKNLVSFEALKEKEEIVDVETLKTNAYGLFTSKLSEMNDNYKVIYDYADKYVVESFINKYSILESNDFNDMTNNNSNMLSFNASIEYQYDLTTSFPSENIDEYHPYCVNLMPYINGDWDPTKYVTASYKYDADMAKYKYQSRSGSINYPTIADEITDYGFVSFLKGFTKENVIDCTFNNNGDCRISFNYYSQNYSSSTPYQKIDYIYEFNVTKDGEITKCYVYEKDFLDQTQKGDLYCKISYEKGKSLITSDMLSELLEELKTENSEITNWFDAFGYELNVGE